MSQKTIANRYILREELGEGGMGTVYEGVDTQTNRPVAIKALKASIADPNMIERFIREGESLRRLNHPNIVKMLDSAQENGQHYLIMELVTGGSLQAALEARSKMPIKQALEIALDLADALTRAHRLNIIHRDIKPANVLLDSDGTPRLTDFGIARTNNSTITETGTIIGTTAYLAPELLKGRAADESADIWSFGVMLFEMLTGRLPFNGDNPSALIYAILSEPIPDLEELNPDVPAVLVDLIERMLRKDPVERIPSVRLVGAEIEAIIQHRPYDTSSGVLASADFQAVNIERGRFATPTSTPSQPKHNLPANMTPFVGREREVTTVSEILSREGVRLVTMTGPAGIGKTRLSMEIAHRLLKDYLDGVFQIPLAPVIDPENVALTIANALDIRQSGDKPPLDLLKDYLQDKTILLLLDSFEHVTKAAPIISEMLMAAPKLSVLVTSRRLLNLRGENEFAVTSLSVPELGEQGSVDELCQYEAVQLFINRAQTAKSNFEATEENLTEIIAICHQLDGIPLAIELAAARIKLLPLQNLLTRLSSRLKLLTGGAQDLPARQQTLRSAIDWSFSLLEKDEQTLFARLAVFVNGFSLESAETVTNHEGNLDILTGVESLMSNSLLWQRQSKNGDMRFGMLETIREYALEKLAEAGEDEQVRRIHAHYFADQMDNSMLAQGLSNKAMDWLMWCDDEHDNLLAALNWGYESDSDVAKRLLFSMNWFWYRRGFLREGYDWTNRILGTSGKHEATIVNGLALGSGATLATWIGDLDSALQRAEESVAILKMVEEGPFLAFMLMGNGVVLLNRGEESNARYFFETSLDMFRTFKMDWTIAVTLMHLGNVELAAGDPVAARKRLDEAHEVAQRVGDMWLVASVVNNLGEIARVQGDYGQARIHYVKSETLYREMGDKGDLARLIYSRGYIALHEDDYDTAEAQFRESLKMFQILGSKRGMAECIAGFAGLALKTVQAERTVRLLGAAQAIMDTAHAGWWPSDQMEIRRFLETARASLDEESFETIKAEGAKMTLEQALADAMH